MQIEFQIVACIMFFQVKHPYRILHLLLWAINLWGCSPANHSNHAIADDSLFYRQAEDYTKAAKTDSAILLYKKAANLAIQKHHSLLQGNSLSNIATLYNDDGNFDSSPVYAQKALAAYQSISIKNKSYFDAAQIILFEDVRKGNFATVAAKGLKFLEEAKQVKDTYNMAMVLNALAESSYTTYDFEKAIAYRTEAIQLAQHTKDSALLAQLYGNLALVYSESGNAKKAIEMGYNAIQTSASVDLANTYDIMGDAYYQSGKTDSAFYFLNLSKQAINKNTDPQYYLNLLSSYAVIYLDKKAYTSALLTLDTAIHFSYDKKIVTLLSAFFYMKASAYEGMKNYKEALYWTRIADSISTQQSGEATQKEIAQLESQHRLKEKESNITHLTKLANTNKQKLQYTLVLILLLVLFSLFIAWQNHKQRKAGKLIKQQAENMRFLIKEIHHRIKNNLQIISSLINMQLRYSPNRETENLLKETQNRIQSIALIHQRLYQTEEIEQIQIKNYLEQLFTALQNVYGTTEKNTTSHLQIEDLSLDLDTAIPLGLILTELISNTYKHAKPPANDSVAITINLKKEADHYTLYYADNGAECQVEKKQGSLGLNIISLMTQQIQGKFSQPENRLAHFYIRFKNKQQRKSTA
jgi:two-component sensor histidine kinase